jgi:pyridoxal phosphate enzyme (YggS family)
MTDIAERLVGVRAEIDDARARARRTDDVQLIAVSKTMPAAAVRAAFLAGQTVFGENRVQEALTKQEALGDSLPGIAWHMIGHLQTNKVKQIPSNFALVESVDSLRLARRLDSQAAEAGVVLPVLFEVNVAGEESKSGFSPEELEASCEVLMGYANLDPRGLMTVAPQTNNPGDVRPIFGALRDLRDRIRERFDREGFSDLSMGMSGDFREAIEEGATMVRLGRAIFGDRPPA